MEKAKYGFSLIDDLELMSLLGIFHSHSTVSYLGLFAVLHRLRFLDVLSDTCKFRSSQALAKICLGYALESEELLEGFIECWSRVAGASFANVDPTRFPISPLHNPFATNTNSIPLLMCDLATFPRLRRLLYV
jgi:hypothetical protein